MSHPLRLAGLILLAAVILVSAMPGRAADKDPVVVLINSSRPEKAVSSLDLIGIYLGQTPYWGDHSAIVPILPPSGDLVANVRFYQFLGTSQSKLRGRWMAKVSRGEVSRPPVQVKTGAESLDFLSRTPRVSR